MFKTENETRIYDFKNNDIPIKNQITFRSLNEKIVFLRN